MEADVLGWITSMESFKTHYWGWEDWGLHWRLFKMCFLNIGMNRWSQVMIPYETRTTAMHTSTFKEQMVQKDSQTYWKAAAKLFFQDFLLETFEYLNLRAYMNKPCMHSSFKITGWFLHILGQKHSMKMSQTSNSRTIAIKTHGLIICAKKTACGLLEVLVPYKVIWHRELWHSYFKSQKFLVELWSHRLEQKRGGGV